jgi:serine/threonine protein kinase
MTAPHEPSAGYSSFEPEQEERLTVGQLVAMGRYRVTRELGHGGMAVVYEVEDLRVGQAVALKVVVRKLADRADAEARYHNEARLAAALGRHPNVVHPHEVGRLPELHDRLYLATELVRGRSLGAVVLEEPRGLAMERACRIGRDVAQALVALHARSIVHRDVKPGNVMLEETGGRERARLLDFGCAYATGDGGVAASADLTQAHERVGSPLYMAPEQALGLRPTPSFDLYAFGATLYELLTGAPPYAGSSKAEVVRRKCATHDPPLPVARLRDGIPPRLAALVDRCLAREASDRPASAAVVLGEIEAVMLELGLGSEVACGSAGSTRWLVLVAVALLLFAGVTAVVALVVHEHTEGVVLPVAADVPPSSSSSDPDERAASPTETGSTSDRGGSDYGERPTSTTALPTSSTDDGASSSSGAFTSDDATQPTLRPKPPRWSTPECERARAQATNDRVARRWQALLDTVTRDRKCWQDSEERLLLRLTALSGLRRHEECVRLGASSMNRQIQRITSQCRHELSERP